MFSVAADMLWVYNAQCKSDEINRVLLFPLTVRLELQNNSVTYAVD